MVTPTSIRILTIALAALREREKEREREREMCVKDVSEIMIPSLVKTLQSVFAIEATIVFL